MLSAQALSERGFGGLLDPPNASLPGVPGESYFASWAWAASKGIPDPRVLRLRSADPVWGFHPADAYPPPRGVLKRPRGAE